MIPTKTRTHKAMLAEWTSEILSLSQENMAKSVNGCIHTYGSPAPWESSGVEPSPLPAERRQGAAPGISAHLLYIKHAAGASPRFSEALSNPVHTGNRHFSHPIWEPRPILTVPSAAATCMPALRQQSDFTHSVGEPNTTLRSGVE